jgi:hypothetical protein
LSEHGEFYKGQLISPVTHRGHAAGLTMDQKYLNSSRHQAVMNNILGFSTQFEKKTGIQAAPPAFVPSTMTSKVASEMKFSLFWPWW